MKCRIVSLEGPILEDEIWGAVCPSVEGSVGILDRHAPFVCELKAGKVSLKYKGGERKEVKIDGGYAEVSGNELTILTGMGEVLSGG